MDALPARRHRPGFGLQPGPAALPADDLAAKGFQSLPGCGFVVVTYSFSRSVSSPRNALPLPMEQLPEGLPVRKLRQGGSPTMPAAGTKWAKFALAAAAAPQQESCQGTTAPSANERLGSGMINSGSNASRTPSPSHAGHAP